MSGTQQPTPPKPLTEYTLNKLREMHAALAPLYPPVVLTDYRELSQKRDEMQWAGGANQVVRDIETAIQQKIENKEQ